MLLISAYIASLFVSLVLTHAFARVIKSNALAKKIFPLIDGAITVAIWIMTGLYILSALGININALVTGAGVGGILFALASKEFVSNLFGSLSLIFSHNFKIHDSIRVKGYEGVVEEISLSYTKLIDKKGTVIFMPNKLIISETVENLSMSPTKKAEFTLDLPTTDVKDIRKTLESIEKEVRKIGGEEMKVSSSIDGLTEKGYAVTIKIETEAGDISGLKKDIWVLLGGKTKQ